MPRPESSAVFVTWSLLAPSARAGSERPAAATIRRITRPPQKIGEGHEPLPIITNQSVVCEKSMAIATRAPEQTTSEASPAPAASTTRSQTLRTAPPKLDQIGHMVASYAEGRHEVARSWRPIALASHAIHRSAWNKYSRKFTCRMLHETGPMRAL